MGVPTVALPDDSPNITYAFDVAMNIVNPLFGQVPSQPGSWTVYEQAVYNLGGDRLVYFAPDQAGQTYFTTLRQQYSINNQAGTPIFTPGVVSSASDVSTSSTILNPEFMQTLTLLDLQNLQTPWGRQYLALAQLYGSLWNLV